MRKKWPSIKESIGTITPLCQQNASASRCPTDGSADQRSATEIRMSRRCFEHHPTKDNYKKAPPTSISLCTDPEAGAERLIYKPACVDKTMPILTCAWMWVSYYWEGCLKRRWEAPGFEYWERSCRHHLLPVAIHPPSSPQQRPFPFTPIGRLIILSQRHWPNLHVRRCRGNVTEQRASAALQIGDIQHLERKMLIRETVDESYFLNVNFGSGTTSWETC